MGQKLTKNSPTVKKDELASLQVSKIDYYDYQNNANEYLKAFFLNDDIDCMQIPRQRVESSNWVLENIERVRASHQKYRCFFHPSESTTFCILKKNDRTEDLSNDWSQNSYDASHGIIESLMQTLLKVFLEDDSVSQFTLYNIDMLNFPRLDEIIRQFQRQFRNLEITKKSTMASGKFINCVVSKAEKTVCGEVKDERFITKLPDWKTPQ